MHAAAIRTDERARMAENDQRPSAEEIVLYEKDPATKIATITLDRADELNAMTIDAQHRYADLVRQANIDDDVKVLVIRANGPNLGSGADLPELMDIMAGRSDVADERTSSGSPRTPTSSTRRRRSYRYGASNVQFYTDPAAGMRSLQDFKKVSILEVRGYCYGWHFYQAADADIVIAVRGRAVRPRRLPLRRLGRAAVAVVHDDGRPPVHGDGVHRPPVHAPRRCTSAASSTPSCRSTSSRR